MPAAFVASASAAAGAAQTVYTPPTGNDATLKGWAAKEDTGSGGATIVIEDGQGNMVVPITLSAGESIREFVPNMDTPEEFSGIRCPALAIHRLAGTSTVTLYYG